MSYDPEHILPGCYYPGCDNTHAKGQKFCPAHTGKGAAAHAVLLPDGTYEVTRS